MNEFTAYHWFQNFRSGYLSPEMNLAGDHHKLYMMKPCRRPLKRTFIQRVVNLQKKFNVQEKIVTLHLHILRETYMLSNWVLYMPLEVQKRQRVASHVSLISHYLTASIFFECLPVT